MSNPLEDQFLQVNGVRLHTIQAGPADGPLVVLLHGFPEFWYGWRNQIEPLAQAGFRVIAPDQRGYNLSDKPATVHDYRLDNLARDVTGLIDAAGRGRAFIVGHDWGAAVAWHLAIHFPQRVEKLAILNVPHPAVMERFIRTNPEQMRRSWYIFFFQIPRLPEALLRRSHFAAMAAMLKGSRKPGVFSPEAIDEYKKAWAQPGALTSMINWYRAIFRDTLKRSLRPKGGKPGRVKMPVLVLWGKRDVALSAKMVQPSLDLCDQGRGVFFENATHWVQHDEAEAVNRELLQFLRS